MTSPFIFHFSIDTRGFPLAATLVDLEIRCSACHNLNYQRYFHAIPLHPITLERLCAFNDTIPNDCQGTCSFCHVDLTPNDVRATVLTWGFSDGLGVLRILKPSYPADKLLFLGDPYATFDPQLIPHFDLNDGERELPSLTEDAVYDLFRRYFSIKRAILRFIQEAWGSETPVAHNLTKSLRMIVWRTSCEETQENAEFIESELTLGEGGEHEWTLLSIEECSDFSLITQPHSQEIAGRAETWLGPSIWGKIMSGELKLKFLVNLAAIEEAAGNVLREGLLTFETSFDGGSGGLSQIAAPNGEPYSSLSSSRTDWAKVDPDKREATMIEEMTSKKGKAPSGLHNPDITFVDIAKRAIYTGIPPETAARLTGEEIVAQFLRVDRAVRGPGKLLSSNSEGCC